MKKIILMAIFMPYLAYGQIVDNFESGSLNSWVQNAPERWKADALTPLRGNLSLHHVFDNPDNGFDKAGIELKNYHPAEGTTEWTFLLRHGYAPSSSNSWMVFLMSDANPEGMSVSGASGYLIGVNITGSDDSLRLVKVKNGTVKTIVSSGINWETQIGITDPALLRIVRSPGGTWTLTVSKSGVKLSEKSSLDAELFTPAWFGLCYKYTSTKDRLLWFDDLSITGPFFEDFTAPSVNSFEMISRNRIRIAISENAADTFSISGNFRIEPSGLHPVRVEAHGVADYTLTFPEPFLNKDTNTLVIRNICDRVGNTRKNVRLSFFPAWGEPGDVMISEIMYDPVPAVSLPLSEYLELYNRTDYDFDLAKWKLRTPETDYPVTGMIHKGERMILCAATDTASFRKYGRTIGLKQFPALNDDGKVICLYDSTGILIHGVDYSPAWIAESLKREGGWSLEMIDACYPFYSTGNWSASKSTLGGTPGHVNSVSRNNADVSFEGIVNVFPLDNQTITVKFSEPVLSLTDHKENISIGGEPVREIRLSDLLCTEFIVSPGTALEKGNQYTLEVANALTDFAGNHPEKREFVTGITEKAGYNDLMFNELLFNPFQGDADYIELYNNSSKIIDASRLLLVSVNDETADTSSAYFISDEPLCLMPGSYYAVTTGRIETIDRYQTGSPANIHTVKSLPSMPDDHGHLILYNRELEKIDEVFYNEKMHFALLSGNEGVALEKINVGMESASPSSWHSAAGSSGWGTPGAVNSVFSEVPEAGESVSLSSTRITPDSDGYEDFLTIGLNLAGAGNVMSIAIFDETGNLVRRLASNMLVQPGATFIWDGTAGDGSVLRNGIYVMLITGYNEQGKIMKWKRVCAVVR